MNQEEPDGSIGDVHIRACAGGHSRCEVGSDPIEGTHSTAPVEAPVVVPRATQYDITSRINGETYRILVSTPIEADPPKSYPAVFLLDGNM